jgi:hypothetical protein
MGGPRLRPSSQTLRVFALGAAGGLDPIASADTVHLCSSSCRARFAIERLPAVIAGAALLLLVGLWHAFPAGGPAPAPKVMRRFAPLLPGALEQATRAAIFPQAALAGTAFSLPRRQPFVAAGSPQRNRL